MNKIKIYKDRFLKTIKNLLSEGTSPEKLGATIVLGILFGTIPLLGINSLILAVIALRFRLNHIIIQAVNYAVFPLQLMLLVPFYKSGQWIFRTEHSVNIKVSDFVELLSTNFFHAASEFSFMILKGVTVWIIVAIPIGFLFYSIFVYFLRNLSLQLARKK